MNKITKKITAVLSAAVISVSACMAVYADYVRVDSTIELATNSRYTGPARAYKYNNYGIKFKPWEICRGTLKNSYSVQVVRGGFFNSACTGFVSVKYSSTNKWVTKDIGRLSVSKASYDFDVSAHEFGPRGDVIL